MLLTRWSLTSNFESDAAVSQARGRAWDNHLPASNTHSSTVRITT